MHVTHTHVHCVCLPCIAYIPYIAYITYTPYIAYITYTPYLP